jgi:hypothetical protein
VAPKINNDEDDAENDEAHHLKRFAVKGVACSNCNPGTWNGAITGDQVANGVAKDMIHIPTTCIADFAVRIIELLIPRPRKATPRKKINRRYQRKSCHGSTVCSGASIRPSLRLRDRDEHKDLAGRRHYGCHPDGPKTCVNVSLCILARFLDVLGNLEYVSWSLRDGEKETEGEAAWNGSEADDDTPHLVDCQSTDATALASTCQHLQPSGGTP